MISHRHKCIFVEVPKTGSSSIRSILGMAPDPHLNIWQSKFELERYWCRYGGCLNRLIASFYLLLPAEKRRRSGSAIFRSYFKFGFVRNPWDRVVSLYERREGLQLRGQMSFEEFVNWLDFSSGTCVHPVPHRNQLDWFVDPHGNILVDFIGRFETLKEDWAFIARRLGIPETLPHENRNPRRKRHYTEYYTPKTRALVADKFRVDIQHFGYQFDPLPSAPSLAAGSRATASCPGPSDRALSQPICEVSACGPSSPGVASDPLAPWTGPEAETPHHPRERELPGNQRVVLFAGPKS